MKTITKEMLKEKNACENSFNFFIEDSNENVDYQYKRFMENERYSDLNWFFSRFLNKEKKVKYALFSAEQVIHIYEKEYPNDTRPRKAIESVKLYLEKKSTADYASDAADAAYATANDDATIAAYYSAYAATYAAYTVAAFCTDDAATYTADTADAAVDAYAADTIAAYYASAAADTITAAYTDDAATYTAAYAAADASKQLIKKILDYGYQLLIQEELEE